jgi:hypothetical protein
MVCVALMAQLNQAVQHTHLQLPLRIRRQALACHSVGAELQFDIGPLNRRRCAR